VDKFYREVEDANQYEIYCFEPEPETFKILQKQTALIKNVNLINKAVGILDGNINFYPGQVNHNEGGTLILGKLTGAIDYKHPIVVKSIDFVWWLRRNFTKKDFIIIKINIEGGEYVLMLDMLEKDITGMIDQIYIQLHAHKFKMG